MVVGLFGAFGVPACVLSDGNPILAGGDTAEPEDVIERSDDAGADRDGHADDRGADDAREDFGADGDGDGDGDADGGCTPVLSAAFNVVLTAADGEERPVALRSMIGFVFFGRPPAPIAADGLRFQRLDLEGAATVMPVWTLSSVELGPQHPLLELPDGTFATAFTVTSGVQPGIWMKVFPSRGTGGEVPYQVPGTDENSSTPTITFDGVDVVAAWMHYIGGTVEIRAQHVSASTGVAMGSAVTVASGPTGTKEPRIAWGDFRHALTYFSASDGALHVLSLDGSLAAMREDVLTPAADESFVGYPALAWGGTQFGLAWETRSVSTSTIHLATFMADGTPVEHTPLEGIVPLTASDGGRVGLAFGDVGNEWGLAWRRAETGRVGISLVRIDASDFHIKDGPIDMRSETTSGWNPSVAYNNGYYMVTWVEQPGAGFPIYEATYGCTPQRLAPRPRPDRGRVRDRTTCP